MARRLYDFKCEDSHITEHFVNDDVKEVQCGECDGKATRIISPITISLDPCSGQFLGATAKWSRMRAEKLALERKQNS